MLKSIVITVIAPEVSPTPSAPVSNPGPDMIINYADRRTVQLNGTATDANLDTVTYSWRRSGGTGGYNAVFSNINIK